MPDPVDAPTKPCHNCRRQRLRCDRSYPHCNKCTSLGKQCLGYGKLFRWTGAVASRGKLAGKTSSAAVHGQEDPGTSPASFPEVRSLSGSPTTSSFFSDASTGSPDSQLQLARRRSPSTEPSCANQYVLIDPLFQDLSSTHRYYLSYYKDRFCQDLVSQDVNNANPFRALLPLTRAHPLLQHVVVAASAAHMSNQVRAHVAFAPKGSSTAIGYQQTADRALRDALVSKQKALGMMSAAIQDLNMLGGDVALAAALFFVNIELIESGKHGWRAHLEGAANIMALLQPSSASDEALRDYMLSDCFIYFILASAFMPVAQQMHLKFKIEPEKIPQILGRAAHNSYFCCPPEILQILHAASELANLPPEENQSEETAKAGLELLQRAQSFDVIAWASDVLNIPSLKDVPIVSRIHAGSAHRVALCLYILQAVPSLGQVVGPELREQLGQDIFSHLDKIPDHDPNFKATTWPTFIAGAEAYGQPRQDWIMNRLQRLVVSCPWGFLYTAMEALPVIWGMDDKEKGTRNWLQALKDPNLNFLIV